MIKEFISQKNATEKYSEKSKNSYKCCISSTRTIEWEKKTVVINTFPNEINIIMK